MAKRTTRSTQKERRKTPRRPIAAQKTKRKAPEQGCAHCSSELKPNDRALFVEEEIGRIFCSESCIAAYFTPDIERLEKEYHRVTAKDDFTTAERESLAHLRWITLQEPDEIWREKTLAGDYRYTLISEFKPGSERIWYVCICLFLRGEPSFLFIAFPTAQKEAVDAYRKGERMQWLKDALKGSAKSGKSKSKAKHKSIAHSNSATEDQQADPTADGEGERQDRLATEWTEEESFLANLALERGEDDIPAEAFGTYSWCIEETLDTPDEVWSLESNGMTLYHFIKRFVARSNEGDGQEVPFWYVIVARETESEEEIEILDAAPTRDSHLVNRYRQGEQQVFSDDDSSLGHVVH